ncbi:hypothetical protein EH165_14925 [Nakamurella antarctica]|uniref:AAA domain-containing protein n=1 Tax=Nakamurella antarctica TaxID=1902245 RepID=A0A3G8ZPQ1_9ACTN|nr:hypothetical protein [Nakamurella antarctica]AZI59240.1 hypothetical protein EH165_14925 [Nakamurella antarctica]
MEPDRRAGAGDEGRGLVASLAAGTPLTISVPQIRPGLDVISGGEALDDLAGILLSRHTRGGAIADVLAQPLAELLEEANYDLVIIDCPPGDPTYNSSR